MRTTALTVIVCGSIALSSCVASMAASAVGAAVSAANPEREVGYSPALVEAGRNACRSRAAQAGSVHIIDADQGERGRITVWGTVTTSEGARPFECTYDGRSTTFRMRAARR